MQHVNVYGPHGVVATAYLSDAAVEVAKQGLALVGLTCVAVAEVPAEAPPSAEPVVEPQPVETPAVEPAAEVQG